MQDEKGPRTMDKKVHCFNFIRGPTSQPSVNAVRNEPSHLEHVEWDTGTNHSERCEGNDLRMKREETCNNTKNATQLNNSDHPTDHSDGRRAAIGVTDDPVATEDTGAPDDSEALEGSVGIVDPVVHDGSVNVVDPVVHEGNEVIERWKETLDMTELREFTGYIYGQ